LARAIELGCLFAINSDAHATGQLEWQPFGCDKAAAARVPVERIINTWPVEDLLAWVGQGLNS
jgi:putative hydrolase